MDGSAERWALVPDRIVDGTGGAALADAGVVVADGRIERIVSPASELRDCGVSEVRRFEGTTLLPGLIDAHVHIGADPRHESLMTQHFERSDDMLLLTGARNLSVALRQGITTVRSLGSRGEVEFQLKRAADAGIGHGARLVIAGRPLTVPRGHCYYMGGEVADACAISRTIEEQVSAGADLVKVMVNGGGCTPGTGMLKPQFTDEELTQVAESAQRHGVPVAAHVNTAAEIRKCLERGYRTLEHAWFLTPDGIRNDSAAMALLARSNACVVTTRYQFCPLRHRDDLTGGLKLEVNSTFRTLYHEVIEQYGHFRAAGVTIVAGTDAGIPGVDFNALPCELELMVEAGYAPLEAIRTATGLAAQALGLDDRGILEPGRRADLLLVRGRPDRDIGALKNVDAVVQGGEVVVP